VTSTVVKAYGTVHNKTFLGTCYDLVECHKALNCNGN